MSVKTTNAAELTAEQVQRILVQPLRESSKFLSAGPRIFDSASPIRIPMLNGMVDVGTTDASAPDWIGETEEITERDVDFGEVQLLPSTMKSIKTISRYSNEMARQSVVALDSTIQQELVFKVTEKLDEQLFSATGDGITTPRGLLAYAGVQEMDKANTELGLDDLIDAWGLCLSGNVNMSGLKWIMRPETFVALRKIKESTGSNRSVLTPDPTNDAVFRLLGSPVVVTKHLPLGPDAGDVDTVANEENVVLADFSQIAVARDLAPSVTILKELFAKTDEQGIRVVTRYDAAPLNPSAIVKIKNIAPAAAYMRDLPTAQEVAEFMQLPAGETDGIEPHLSSVTAFVRAYTRGRGFRDDTEGTTVTDGIAAVIVQATVRSVTNPAQVTREEVGSWNAMPARFEGFTLAEQFTLNEYRRRTA